MNIRNENNNIDPVTRELTDEMLVQIQTIRSILLEIKMISSNTKSLPVINQIIYKIFRAFHCISGISDFVNFDSVKNICNAVELFLNKCMKNLLYDYEKLITDVNIIINAIYYIEKICNDPDIQSDIDFKSEIYLFLRTVKNAVECSDSYEIMR